MNLTRLLATTLLGFAAMMTVSERDARADVQPGVGWCQARPSSGSTSILTAPDLGVELDFKADGNLSVVATDGRGEAWSSYTTGTGEMLCLQADGNLVLSNLTGGTVFATQTGGLGILGLAVDACGVSLSSGGVEYWRAGAALCWHMPASTDQVSITARATSRFVSAENAGASALIANRTELGDWEGFQISMLGGGKVALKSLINGKYVTAENAGASPLIANRTAVGPWETFQWIDLPGGDFALRAQANGQFVSATGGTLIADRGGVSDAERFHWQPMPLPKGLTSSPISMLAHADNSYVTADNGGASALIANRTAVGSWESFQVTDLGNGNVSLKSMSNGKYVTADNAGASPLIASKPWVSLWETFQWVNLGNGDFALRAVVNGKYVTAENAGASALIANRTAIGAWETFHWQPSTSPTLGTPLSGGGRTFSWDQSWGDSTFGAEMWIGATAVALSANFAGVTTNAGVSATVFSNNINVLYMDGTIGNFGGPGSDLSITAMGVTVRSWSMSPSADWSVTKTFFEESQTFMLGPVPLYLHADVTGTLDVASTFTAGTAMSAAVTPSANLSVNASVGVGCDVASAGVEGSLTLINASVPLSLGYDLNQRAYSATSDLVITTLGGNLDLYAEVTLGYWIFSYSQKYTHNVASWDGFSYSTNLLSMSGTL